MNCENCENWKPKEPVHYAGEVFSVDDNLEYSGDKRSPKSGEPYEVDVCNPQLKYRIASLNHKSYMPDRWILQPIGTHAKRQEQEPLTKVTVWAKQPPLWTTIGWYKDGYSFTGTPDIDRVIRETKLGKPNGALAIKIECNEPFIYPDDSFPDVEMTIFPEYLILNGKHIGDDCRYRLWYGVDDSRIESAITEYLKDDIQVGDIVISSNSGDIYKIDRYGYYNSQVLWCISPKGIEVPIRDCNLRKVTRDEVLEYFTVEVDGNLYVAYDTGYGGHELLYRYYNDIGKCFNCCDYSLLAKLFIKANNITPITYKWWSKLWNEPQYPRKGE